MSGGSQALYSKAGAEGITLNDGLDDAPSQRSPLPGPNPGSGLRAMKLSFPSPAKDMRRSEQCSGTGPCTPLMTRTSPTMSTRVPVRVGSMPRHDSHADRPRSR
jgi:hypothetical protein